MATEGDGQRVESCLSSHYWRDQYKGDAQQPEKARALHPKLKVTAKEKELTTDKSMKYGNLK